MRISRLSRTALALVLASSGAAQAAERPALPAPFVVPPLSHAGIDARADWFVGRLSPARPARPGAFAGIARVAVEAPVLAPRRLYVGASYSVASALPPDGALAPGEVARPSGARTMPGNVEGHVRAVFALPTWLEIGMTLGVVLPTAGFGRAERAARSASVAAASLDPTAYAHYLPGRVGFRPGGDVRIVRGPFVFQARQGIDVLIDGQGIEGVATAGRLLAHAGYLARPDLEVSLEASQIYFFASTDPARRSKQEAADESTDRAFAEAYRISDGRRAALTVGPAVRVALPSVDVGAALITNLGDPLSPAADGVLGLRVSVIARGAR